MLSLYRAWLGPSPCVARPAPPPGAHRPVPRRARVPSPPVTPPPPSPSSTTSSELDVERIEAPEPPKHQSNTIFDIACCDGPVQFSRVLNSAWKESSPEGSWCRHRKTQRATLHYYPCKTCGSKFPSYYFVHKHRKRCHAEEVIAERALANEQEPAPSTSTAT